MNQVVDEMTTPLLSETEQFLSQTAAKVLKGERIGREEARRLASVGRENLLLLFYYADKIRRTFCGDAARVCSIINAKSGSCSEDCSFCAQSVRTFCDSVAYYPLVETDVIRHAAEKACEDGATGFGIVISGRGVKSRQELEKIGDAVETIARLGKIAPHASLGMMGEEDLRYLKERGLECFHHNLETSKAFFDKVCTTHTYAERAVTVRAVKKAGLRGLFRGYLRRR